MIQTAHTMLRAVARVLLDPEPDVARAYALVEHFESQVMNFLHTQSDKTEALRTILQEGNSMLEATNKFSDGSIEDVVQASMRKYKLQKERLSPTPFELVPKDSSPHHSSANPLRKKFPENFKLEKFDAKAFVRQHGLRPSALAFYNDSNSFAGKGGVTVHKLKGCVHCDNFDKNFGAAVRQVKHVDGIQVKELVGGEEGGPKVPLGPVLFVTKSDGQVYQITNFQTFYGAETALLVQQFLAAGASRPPPPHRAPALVTGDGPALTRARPALERAVLSGRSVKLELDPTHKPGAVAVIRDTGRDAELLNLVQSTTLRPFDDGAIEARMKALTLDEGQVYALHDDDTLEAVTPTMANGFVTLNSHVLAPTTTAEGSVFYMGAARCGGCSSCSRKAKSANKTIELHMKDGTIERVEAPEPNGQALAFSAHAPCLVTDTGAGSLRFTKAGEMPRYLTMTPEGVYRERV